MSLGAAKPSGEAPSCEARTRLPHRSLFGARRRLALSTVGACGATAGLRKTHDRLHGCQARGALTQRRLYVGNPSEITDTRMVHQ
ncbi:Protein of unknown function [Mycobacterium canettii CIPT 140070010]|nr:Protein of unknown function [Mycobacterium canettii CIPT 140070010]